MYYAGSAFKTIKYEITQAEPRRCPGTKTRKGAIAKTSPDVEQEGF
jgi:hypothetical protein